MKKICTFLGGMLLAVLGITQEPAVLQSLPVTKLEHPNVEVRNAYRINTDKLEFSPAYYQNGVVYVSAKNPSSSIDKNIGVPFFELLYAEMDGSGMPDNAQPFSSKVNTTTHEGPTTFSLTEDRVFYTSNSKVPGTSGNYVMKIFTATKGANEWENIRELSFNSNDFSTMHPTLSANGNRLYFASNRPGGYGGTDLYYVEKDGDQWGAPINMGAAINTPQNEAFPFIHQSGILFFASEGHDGMGGYDLFAVNIKRPQELFHLGEPLNSANADLGLILNPTGTQGFFTSSRYGGLGQDDIYQFDAPNGLFTEAVPKPLLSTITVIEKETGRTVPSAGVYIFEKSESGLFGEEGDYEVVLQPKAEGSQEVEVKLIRKKELGQPDFFTNQNGFITTQLTPNQDFLFLVTKDGYQHQEYKYHTMEQSPVAIQIPLSGTTCSTLSGFIYDENSALPISEATVDILSSCESGTTRIKTDKTGGYSYCLPVGCTYTLRVQQAGYLPATATVAIESFVKAGVSKNIFLGTTQTTEPNKKLPSERLEEGTTIVLENIYYDFNKSAIRSGAADELDALASLMQKYPSMEIELTAHTDARGTREYNRQLSQDRAASARNYLIRKGVASTRISATGKGESEIRNHCLNGVRCSDFEHEYNRRTEVRVTRLDENVEVQYSGRL